MNTVLLEKPKPLEKTRLVYSGTTAYTKLEHAMHQKKVYQIGKMDSWKLRINERGEERYGGMDMSPIVRAYRTMDVKKLNTTELLKIHEFEIKKLTRFLMLQEMRRILQNADIPDAVYLNDIQLATVTAFNERCRPLVDRHCLGLPIPPYFYYDYDFDGMAYHHAWDKAVCRESFILPRNSKKGMVSDEI